MAVSFHLRVTSVYVSHLRLVGEPHTVGCLPMCCPLIHCMAALLLQRCLMPGGLLGAISGILAGGILGFGAAEWIVLLDTFARSCFLFWCFVFVSVQDLVIQWHHQSAHWSFCKHAFSEKSKVCAGQSSSVRWFT